MLVDIILSHRTRNEQTAAAYRAIEDRFGSWEAVRDAPTAPVTWPELKAPRIQALLRRITAERGELSLDFLCELPVAEGAAWLGRPVGVGPKTIACVLLFSCRQPLLPVDTHVHRVSGRRGLIGPRVAAAAAHALLGALLPDDAQTIYDFHRGLLKHGQRVCLYARPRCDACALTDLCRHYRTVVRPDEDNGPGWPRAICSDIGPVGAQQAPLQASPWQTLQPAPARPCVARPPGYSCREAL